jgi:hypothetical protein
MAQYDLGPSKNGYLEDEMLGQYETNYAPFGSMDLPMQQSYPDSNAHVNPLEYHFRFQ